MVIQLPQLLTGAIHEAGKRGVRHALGDMGVMRGEHVGALLGLIRKAFADGGGIRLRIDRAREQARSWVEKAHLPRRYAGIQP